MLERWANGVFSMYRGGIRMYSKIYLLNKIESLRVEMSRIALKKGFTNQEAIRISQELDSLLNAYDEIEKRGRKTEENDSPYRFHI